MKLKFFVPMALFMIIGIIVSVFTGKFFYYIPSSMVVGLIVSISFFKSKK